MDKVPLAETMGALAKAKRDGLARHIGVANFNIALLEEAQSVCLEPLATLQAEYHPYLDQSKVLDYCRRHGMIFTAYCPLRPRPPVQRPGTHRHRPGPRQNHCPDRAALAGTAGRHRADPPLLESRANRPES